MNASSCGFKSHSLHQNNGITFCGFVIFCFNNTKNMGLEPPRRRRTQSGFREANDGQSPSSPILCTKKTKSLFVVSLFFVSIEQKGLEPLRRRRTQSGFREENDGQSPSSPILCTKITKSLFVVSLFLFTICSQTPEKYNI